VVSHVSDITDDGLAGIGLELASEFRPGPYRVEAGNVNTAVNDGDSIRRNTVVGHYLLDRIRYGNILVNTPSVLEIAEHILYGAKIDPAGDDAHPASGKRGSKTADRVGVGRVHVNNVELALAYQACELVRSSDVRFTAHTDLNDVQS
jgi:hypothetical protein